MAGDADFHFRTSPFATVRAVTSIQDSASDGVVLVTFPNCVERELVPDVLQAVVKQAFHLDNGLATEVAVHLSPEVAGSRLIISPTGPITPYDDIRSLAEAAKRGIMRAEKAGVRNPTLVLQNIPGFEESAFVLLLGAFEGLYVPLQVRDSGKLKKCENLLIYSDGVQDVQNLINKAIAIEHARTVARDIGGGDPERMSPANVEEYVRNAFVTSKNFTIRVEDNLWHLEREYPLFAAVNRAANEIERHKGRIIFLEYTPEGDASLITHTVLLVGKGVTYDTGGADIKAGGNMAGMSRDKCGAAAVAGFLKLCKILQPKHLKVVGVMSMVRNSVGENAYVADELIIARSKKRIRVGNTDAEGRMIMADLLCLMKDRAKVEVNPHIYSIATLTGHAIRAMGEGYSICIDNHIAKQAGHARSLQASGDRVGDVFEISTLRREDLLAHRGTFEGDDALQANNDASVNTPRGHQNPAGFLLIASGLEGEEVAYSHLDIAGSAGIAPAEATGSPVLALAKMYHLLD